MPNAKSYASIFGASILALTFASSAFAQGDSTVSSVNSDGEKIVVTGQRSGDGVAVKNIPASITVLSDTDMEERQTRIVSDVLRDIPGISVGRSGGIGQLTQVRIRGTESNHVLVLVDGIEATDPYYGEYDFGTLIADPAARLEVLRGQQSSLYGSDAIGGVIQYVTLTGREAPGMSVRAEGGSFGTYSGSARYAGFTDTLDYAVSGTLYNTNGTPSARYGSRKVGSDTTSAHAKVTWSPAPNVKLTGTVRYTYTDAETNYSETNPTDPLFGYVVDSRGVSYTNEAFYALMRGEIALADGRWVTALTGQFTNTQRKGYTEYGFDYANTGRRYKGSLESSYRFGTERVVHRVTAALDLEREEFQNQTPSAYVFQGRRSIENMGVVGQYELSVDDAFFLGASIRYDENDRFNDVTTWRAQAGYRLASGLRLRGSYGTGVKNPGYYELYDYSEGRYIGNPNLKPEKSEGWEVGLDQILGDDLVNIGVTYFESTLKNEIYTSFPAPLYVASPANRLTNSHQKGVEVVLSATPMDQLKLDVAYTYLNAKENGVREARRPRHVASFNGTVFSSDKRFSGTLTIRYNGRQTDAAYTDPSYVPVLVNLKGFVLANINADYKVTENLSVFGRVENLTNENYEEVFSYRTSGRAAYAGVRAKF